MHIRPPPKTWRWRPSVGTTSSSTQWKRIGPAELREGRIWSPEKTQAALLIKGAEWADEVKLCTSRGSHKLKML
jgi:hypothetical protein